ncbi:ABC transporter permease [Sporolactobacillus pectinivorans]|uniref:ABC transporter permease n=1 Tax=Sporolactobacillus pectinivorans TaxID=1591408 RepID=UPI0019614D7F|nr:ABC transporter permease [Sporolactobacillus pectinivorans]
MKDFSIRLIWRIFSGIIMVLVVASLTFFLVRMMPGNPVDAQYNQLIMQGMTPVQAQNQVRVMYGFIPHSSLASQYMTYIANLLRLNLGQSVSYEGVSVSHIILNAAPWTLILVFTGLVASFLIGVLAGVIAAIKRSSPMGTTLTISGSLLHGVPQFVMGLLLAYVFTTLWPILPFGAPYDSSIAAGFNLPFVSSLISHAVLPVATYALSSYGGWLLTMKSSVITVLGDDFILASEIRGLKAATRVRYIAHNAILPLFTLFTLSIGFMFGGSVFIENIFDYPGLGNLLLKSIDARDYPLMSGAFLLITIAVIISNIVTDFLYSMVDPRIRR